MPAFVAMVDEGLSAGTTALTMILLGRWLPETEYGLFATQYSLVILLQVLHGAFFAEPTAILSSAGNRAYFSAYLRVVTGVHFRYFLGLALLVTAVGAGCAALGAVELGVSSIAMAFMAPFWTYMSFLRRTSYVVNRQKVAAGVAAVLFVLCTGGLYALRALGWLSGAAALLWMGVCSAVCASLMWRLAVPPKAPIEIASRRELLRAHRDYATWGLPTAVIKWIPDNIFYFVIPFFAGQAGNGMFRAAMNVVLPIRHVFVAATILLLPRFARMVATRGPQTAVHMAKSIAQVFATMGLAFWLMILLLNQWVVRLLYGEGNEHLGPMVILAAGIPLFSGVYSVVVTLFRATAVSKALSTTVVGAVVTLLSGLCLLPFMGPNGAMAGVVIGAGAAAGWSLIALRGIKARRTQLDSVPGPRLEGSSGTI